MDIPTQPETAGDNQKSGSKVAAKTGVNRSRKPSPKWAGRWTNLATDHSKRWEKRLYAPKSGGVLVGKGIKANKPLHELRKEVGAVIATEQGIYAASKFLRHSDITTTARHYADQKARINVGLGKFLVSKDA